MESIIKKLNVIGLSGYEAKCYMALVEKNELAAADVAKIAGIPRSKVYDVLEELAQKGLCNSIPGPVVKYKSAPPEMLKNKVENKLKIIRKEIEDRSEKLEKTIIIRDEAISFLSDIFKKGKTNNTSLHYAETIKDPLLVHRKICELVLNTKNEILGFTRPPYTVPYSERLEQAKNEEKILKKGIIVKNIYQIPQNKEEIENLIDEIERSKTDGELLKVADELPFKLFIFDEETVVFSLEDPILHKTSLTFSLFKHRSLAKFMKMAFKATWDNALEPEILKDKLAEINNKPLSK